MSRRWARGKPRPRLSRPRSAMPCSTRPACGCAPSRSRPSESRPRSSARACKRSRRESKEAGPDAHDGDAARCFGRRRGVDAARDSPTRAGAPRAATGRRLCGNPERPRALDRAVLGGGKGHRASAMHELPSGHRPPPAGGRPAPAYPKGGGRIGRDRRGGPSLHGLSPREEHPAGRHDRRRACLAIPGGISRPARWRGRASRSGKSANSSRTRPATEGATLPRCTSTWPRTTLSPGAGIQVPAASLRPARRRSSATSSKPGSRRGRSVRHPEAVLGGVALQAAAQAIGTATGLLVERLFARPTTSTGDPGRPGRRQVRTGLRPRDAGGGCRSCGDQRAYNRRSGTWTRILVSGPAPLRELR